MSEPVEKTKKKWRFRFGLRTFLVVVCIICIVLGTWVARWQNQQKAVACFEQWGNVEYEYLTGGTSVEKFRTLIADWFGRDAAINVVEANVEKDFQFQQVKHFPGLQRLTIDVSPCIKSLEPIRNLTHLESLAIRGAGISDLTPVAHLQNLRWIYGLSETNYTGLEAVGALPHLESVYLDSAVVEDLSLFKHPENIEVLRLDGCELTSVEPLEKFTDLKILRLPNCKVTDWSSLSELKSLEYLHLPDGNFHDLNCVNSLANLRQLYVDRSMISDLSPTKNMKLSKFEFSGTPVSDLNPLRFLQLEQGRLNLFGAGVSDFRILGEVVDTELDGINHLKIGGGFLDVEGQSEAIRFGENDLKALTIFRAKSLKQMEGLGLCRSLQDLSLRGVGIEELNELSRCGELRRVDLHDLPMKTVPDLRKISLETLRITRCPVTDLSWINPATLTGLTIENTQLKDLGTLKSANRLVSLNLQGQSLQSLEGCESMVGLRKLHINGTAIKSLDALGKLPNLGTLVIRDSPIEDLPKLKNRGLSVVRVIDCPLQNLRGVRFCSASTLELSGTAVSDLTPLGKMNSLDRLTISSSPVKDLSPLKNCRKLESLSLCETEVSDFEALWQVKLLASLSIGQCDSVDLDVIAQLARLRKLSLKDCGVVPFSLEPTRFLGELDALILNGTNLQDFSFLFHCKNLRTLNLSNSSFLYTSVLSELPSIQSLDLSFTKVTDFSPLQNLKDLRILKVSGKSSEELSELRMLLPQVDSLINCENSE